MNLPAVVVPLHPEWFLPVVPREKQWEIYEATCRHIKTSSEPAYIYASVASGKTIMQAMIAKHCQQVAEIKNKPQLRILCIARTGELVEQNAEEMWVMSARNSIYSASVKIKSTRYPTIVGSEGTLYRSLMTALKNIRFDILLWDECHQLPFDDLESQGMKIVTELQARNPDIKIIGYTGSPWRGSEPIKGAFWKHELYRLSMWEQIETGDVIRPIFGFGHDDVEYKLDDITPSGKDGTEDFDKAQMGEMQRRILADGTTTQKIMLEVMALTENRNCVLITCAGSKHIKECAAVLPEGSYAVITEKTTYNDRREIKKGCNAGTIKYVLQIGCWTVGVNIPPFDTIVILRKIGSLTLLTQLIGRGIRKLKKEHEDLGMIKNDCLCLDYAGTFESLAQFFDDELLESAQLAKAKRKEELVECFRCGTQNSRFARRCMSKDPHAQRDGQSLEKDGRCGFFWSSKVCPKCNTENDKVARSCRECDFALIDPNANLTGKHYVDSDFKPVIKFEIFPTKNKEGLVFKYTLPDDEIATEVHYPGSKNIASKRMWYAFMCQHIHKGWHQRIYGKPATIVLAQKALIDIPVSITHRVNEKKQSIIHRKLFSSGREASETT